MLASLLIALPAPGLAGLLLATAALAGAVPGKAAELLELRIDSLQIPIPLDQLANWSDPAGRGQAPDSDLSVWLGLLEPSSRTDLQRLLRAPLLRDRSFGSQLLDSWAGGQLLAELGNLLTTPDGRNSTALLQMTLRRLLEQRRDVTLLEILQALPPRRLNLQLDGLLSLGERWRIQLRRQHLAMTKLRELPLPQVKPAAGSAATELAARGLATTELATTGLAAPGLTARALAATGLTATKLAAPELPATELAASDRPQQPQRWRLAVPGRREPLPLQIWAAERESQPSKPWVLLMPGLGGNADQFGWLGSALARRGWPVVVLQHPGSDGLAVGEALQGQRPPPGAESLGSRLADLEAVVSAERQGRLPVRGEGLVLAGHSLGGLTALLAAGLSPQPGLEARCRRALERLPLHNPSRLIQCQLPQQALPRPRRPPPELRALLLFNSFGSLLWPASNLAALPLPILMVGGSLDLITPPLDEQLTLFLGARDPRSRLVLVSGGSHFSPVRLAERDGALLRLGRDLVGADPLRVQALLLDLTSEFLASLPPAGAASDRPSGADQPAAAASKPLPPQRRRQNGITAYVLDPEIAHRWRSRL